MEVNRLQLQSSDTGVPGDLGFKLIGASRTDPSKLARIWVRRKKGEGRRVWTRYLDPVEASSDWEVRLHVKRGTGAMTLTSFSPAELDQLAEDYEFPKDPATLSELREVTNTDPLFNLVREWVVKITS